MQRKILLMLYATIFLWVSAFGQKTDSVVIVKCSIGYKLPAANCIVEINYPQIVGSNDSAQISINKALRESLNVEISDNEFYIDCQDNSEYLGDYKILFNQKGIFSVEITNYQYNENAAHGHCWYGALNFNIHTGKTIELEEILTNGYKKVVEKYMQPFHDDLAVYLDEADHLVKIPGYGITKKGLIFYFKSFFEAREYIKILIPYNVLEKYISYPALKKIK